MLSGLIMNYVWPDLIQQASVASNVHILARMPGMLDLSRDGKAKHFLPRWLRDVPTWMRVDLSMVRKQLWNLPISTRLPM